MTLNEHLSQVLAIAEEEKRQESVQRAEKRKPKFIEQLKYQALKGNPEGVIIDDKDRIYLEHLSEFFRNEGFAVAEVEPNRIFITIQREPAPKKSTGPVGSFVVPTKQ